MSPSGFDTIADNGGASPGAASFIVETSKFSFVSG
jgi:hypothetical protein